MSKKFVNLKRLKMSNTQALEHLRANPGIESVVLENSKILSISTFVKRVPTPLLSRNNMADYTQVKLNGTILNESELSKIKLGKMNVEHNDVIEVLDGILAGTIFTIKLGLPLNSMIKDPVLQEHIKTILGKESVSSDVSKYELDTITWIGKDPSQITENSYLGYFNSKTIGNFETFKKDLEWLPNLKYVNLSGSIFSDSVSLSDFPNIENFSYTFADCIVLQSVIVDKNITGFEGTFRNCSNLRTVTIKNVSIANANKSFHNCKGIRNLVIENPNMVDSRDFNTFNEALISETTFSGEPADNTITSKILLDAIASTITLDLTGKKRPDLYNLTSSPNNLMEKIILNNTNIVSLDLTSSNMNFLNLRQILADNTEDARTLKLAGNNIQVLSLENSSILYLQITSHETPAVFIDNSNYYNRVEINSVELDPLQVIELKKGNWTFNNTDMVTILDGPLANKIFEVSDGIIPTRISKMFPDEVLAEYIRIKTNKDTVNDKIRQFEIDAIEYFGSNSIVTSLSTISWFNEKTVDDWTGTNQLRNLKNFFIKGVSGAFTSITINSSKITSLFGAFEGSSNLVDVNLIGGLGALLDASYAFKNCISIINTNFIGNTMNNVTSLKETFYGCTSLVSADVSSSTLTSSLESAFEGCSSLTSVTLPTTLDSLINIDRIFKGDALLTSITLPSIMNGITSMVSSFEGCSSLRTISNFISLNLLRNINRAFYGCGELSSIVLPKNLSTVLTAVDTFNSCVKLTSLELNDLLGVTDITGIINNTPLLRTIYLDPLLTNCATPLELTGLDFPGKTIVYVKNDDIIYYTQIKYHDENAYSEYQNATLDYSRLTNIRPLIRKIFPCPNVAQYIALQLNKTVNSGILIDELHTIEWFGFVGANPTTMSSWFSGKNINSFEGMQHLINLRGICLSQAASTPSTIDLSNYNKLESLQCAFNYCRNLTQITLPTQLNNLRTMSEAFQGCSSLTSIVLPNELPNLTTMISCFKACSKIISITLPQSMPKLENMEMAFYDCTTLQTITFPQSMLKLKSIKTAFRGCRELVDLTMPTETPLLEEMTMAFSSCFLLTSLKLPTSLPKLKNLENAFNGCMDLNLIEMPAVLPLLTTTLANSTLDKEGRVIYYLPDDTVETKAQIKFHNSSVPEYKLSTINYSRLTNLKLMISEVFESPEITWYITMELKKENMDDPVSKAELASIRRLGITDSQDAYFKGRVISSSKGLETLTGVTNVSFEGALFDLKPGSVFSLEGMTSITNMKKAFYSLDYRSCYINIELPENMPNLTSIERAFMNGQIVSVKMPKFAPLLENAKECFCISGVREVIFPKITNIKDLYSAFDQCHFLVSVVLPETFGDIKNFSSSFSQSRNLKKIENIPRYSASVTEARRMFYNSTSLTLEGIGGYIPDFPGLSYADNMFAGTAIEIDGVEFNFNAMISIKEMFFGSSGVKNVRINVDGNGYLLQSINSVFQDCPNLITAEINSDMASATNTTYIVRDCPSLTSIKLPNFINAKDVSYLIYNCPSLTTVFIKGMPIVEKMSNLFTSCNKLKLINIPPVLSKVTTPIESTTLDRIGCTIKYIEDSTVYDKSQIAYHDTNGIPEYSFSTLDYSNLAVFEDGTFLDFFKNAELGEHAAGLVSKTGADQMTEDDKLSITSLGGPNAQPSIIKTNIKYWGFIKGLTNLTTINLSGNTELEFADLSQSTSITHLNNSFRACQNLKNLKFPINCNSLIDMSYIVSNISGPISIEIPAIIPNCTTTMSNTGMDKNGNKIKYYEDPSITTVNQITYFPSIAKPNCSLLVNCTDAPLALEFGEYITSEIDLDDSRLVGKFSKEPTAFRTIPISHNSVLQGIIEITDTDAINNGFFIEVTASVSSEGGWDHFTAFCSKTILSDTEYDSNDYLDRIFKISGEMRNQKYNNSFGAGYKYIYICYRKDSSGSNGEDCGWIVDIKITRPSALSLNDVNKSELNYVTDNPLATPTSLKTDETMSVIEINGKAMHSSVVEQIKSGEFKMPKYGEYVFKPKDGKFKDLVFRCNYKENMFEDDVIEAEIVK
ncbi:MAG: leucine-rich repeat protein [Sarcina sp.]